MCSTLVVFLNIGLSLLELLTGKNPFTECLNPTQLYMTLVGDKGLVEKRIPSGSDGFCPARVRRVILRCCQMDPKERASGDEVVAILRSVWCAAAFVLRACEGQYSVRTIHGVVKVALRTTSIDVKWWRYCVRYGLLLCGGRVFVECACTCAQYRTCDQNYLWSSEDSSVSYSCAVRKATK